MTRSEISPRSIYLERTQLDYIALGKHREEREFVAALIRALEENDRLQAELEKKSR